MPDAAIRIEDVSFSYGTEPFIEGLSASCSQGCITSIVGPNGCGKSTLVKLIDGLYAPKAGAVYVQGEPTLELSGRERARHLAVLSQGAKVPAMTVEALVACGRYPYQGHQGRLSIEDREHVEEAMALAGVACFRDHDLRRLSGGERQRAFIAMTLAQDTELVLMDEPTTYLDIKACHEVMQLVSRLNSELGKTIVMVIHDLDLALRYSQRLIVMQRGTCSFSGTVAETIASKALEQSFQVSIEAHASPQGTGYTLFPS